MVLISLHIYGRIPYSTFYFSLSLMAPSSILLVVDSDSECWQQNFTTKFFFCMEKFGLTGIFLVLIPSWIVKVFYETRDTHPALQLVT